MDKIKKEVRKIAKDMIVSKNGEEILNRDITPIYHKYYPIIGSSIVTIVQDAFNFFKYSPSQEEFRRKYNYL